MKKIKLNCDVSNCLKGCCHWNDYEKICEYILDTGEPRGCWPSECTKAETKEEYLLKVASGEYQPDIEHFNQKIGRFARARQRGREK